MNELVSTLGVVERDGQAMVSSLDVARVFEKEHKDVLKAIRTLDCSGDFNRRNFAPVDYQDKKGETRPAIMMTRDGFTFLAMGFTGERAAQFKEAYISAFNEMENRLKHGGVELEKALTNPDVMLQIVNNWKQERAQRLALEAQAVIDRPKTIFADAVSESKTSILVGDLAKLIKQNGMKIGQKRLFAWLRENGWLMKSGSSKNMPTQKAMEQKLFEIKERTIAAPDGHIIISKTPKVTGKGQMFFINSFLGAELPDPA
ncbi:Rha family transcriptional regulator [Jonquetella anthropi]|uniref:Rha family transcriptional regulator n=1 Tax=Jonquetella anthropi TaxID=428712 RepID=UPI0001B915CF|nr:phage regulatory protein/antirepressor Ant [Jonquetella anthropi]EEX48651.1 phage regulatory protein, Rha family [Jonquetella anthropi E3_33 E1]